MFCSKEQTFEIWDEIGNENITDVDYTTNTDV